MPRMAEKVKITQVLDDVIEPLHSSNLKLANIQTLCYVSARMQLCVLCVLTSQADLYAKSNIGVWVAQSVEHLTSAQVMISQFVGSSPALGSALMAQRLEPASNSVSPSLSAPPLLMLSLSPSKINKNI